jgi:hypothetical protein
MVTALARANFQGPLIFEWDRLWNPGLEQAEEVLPKAAAKLFQWATAARADPVREPENRGRRGAATGT